jgi:IclR family mhp operon transcriptional activator
MIDSAVGQAWLAFCSPEVRQQRLETIEDEADEELAHMIEIAKADIKFGDIREAGYAVRERNTFSAPAGKNSVIAAPIFRNDEPIGALALVYFASTHSLKEAVGLYAETVMETARKIGNELSAD